jgi:hypothetical protein
MGDAGATDRPRCDVAVHGWGVTDVRGLTRWSRYRPFATVGVAAAGVPPIPKRVKSVKEPGQGG